MGGGGPELDSGRATLCLSIRRRWHSKDRGCVKGSISMPEVLLAQLGGPSIPDVSARHAGAAPQRLRTQEEQA